MLEHLLAILTGQQSFDLVIRETFGIESVSHSYADTFSPAPSLRLRPQCRIENWIRSCTVGKLV